MATVRGFRAAAQYRRFHHCDEAKCSATAAHWAWERFSDSSVL